MPTPKQIAHERLKQLLTEADSSSYAWMDSGKHVEWTENVKSALSRLLSGNSEKLKKFNSVDYSPVVYFLGIDENISDESFAADMNSSFVDGMNRAMAIVRSAIQEYEDYEIQSETTITSNKEPIAVHTRKIFVVHGHDNEMKESVARFLERIDFEPIILHEQASGGDTIIEKLERHADVSYSIVLLSPDDVGAVKTDSSNLKPRARQNVVLELGYFIGRLGRSHVCPLVRDSLEVPSDFQGVVYVPFKNEDWKIHLIKELKNLGFDIDSNKAF